MPYRSCTLNLDIEPDYLLLVHKPRNWTIEPWYWTWTLNLYVEPGVISTTLKWRVQVNIAQKGWYITQSSILHMKHLYLVDVSVCWKSFEPSWYIIHFKGRYTVQRLYFCCRINFKHQFTRYFAVLVYIYLTKQQWTRFSIKGNFFTEIILFICSNSKIRPLYCWIFP